MSFTPVIPLGGYAGWRFLNRTLAVQTQSFATTPAVQRDEAYFRAHIGKVTSAEALVSDRRLLKIALGAFGLDHDINNRFFIRKVLEEGTLAEGALANRLADKTYAALSKTFGFGDGLPPAARTGDFAEKILNQYRTRQFEQAVGAQNADMRLALNARRELAELAASESGDKTLWYTIMGSRPLRSVFETALGLPKSFATLDLDQQMTTLRDKTATAFGDSTVAQFRDPERVEALLRRFVLRAQAQGGLSAGTGNSAALQILSASPSASGGILSRRA